MLFFRWLSILVIVVCSLSACTQSPDCFREDVFCAALVTDTRGLNDFGVNQNAWSGLEQSKVEGWVDEIAYIESVDTRDYDKNIAFFVNAGYDVIITSGVGLQGATLRNVDLYPDSVFIGMNQPDEASVPNFISVTFPEDQMGFLAGALAVRLTQTHIVGAACETSGIDAMWRYCEGFRAGANYIDETVEVLVVYRDDGSRENLFIDPDWGYENAQNLIGDGVDVIFAAGGETAVGALRAAAEAKVRAIGAERDQGTALENQGPGVVTSILGHASFTVRELMRNIRAGKLEDVETGPIRYVSLEQAVPISLVDEMNEILFGLRSGELKTNVSDEKP